MSSGVMGRKVTRGSKLLLRLRLGVHRDHQREHLRGSDPRIVRNPRRAGPGHWREPEQIDASPQLRTPRLVVEGEPGTHHMVAAVRPPDPEDELGKHLPVEWETEGDRRAGIPAVLLPQTPDIES